MKTQEQIQKVIKAYEERIKEHERQMSVADTFAKASGIMDNAESYISCIKQYYDNKDKIEDLQTGIKILNWVLDIK